MQRTRRFGLALLALLFCWGVRLSACVPVVSLGTQIFICQGSSVTLSASNPNSTYLWQNGSTSPTYTASNTGLVYVTVTNACGSTTDSVQVTVLPAPNASLGPDTFLCPGQSIGLSVGAQAGVTTLWSTGSSALSTSISAAGTYWVQRSNSCGISRDTIEVLGLSAPSISLPNESWLCAGAGLVLSVSVGPYDNVLWSTGESSASISVLDTGIYSVVVSNPCGSSTASTFVRRLPNPSNLLPEVAYLCQNGFGTIDPGLPPGSYLWSTGSTSSSINVQQSGSVWLSYSGPCGSYSDTVEVIVEPIISVDLGPDVASCDSALLWVSNIPGLQYTWNNGNTSDSVYIHQTGTYWVTYSSNCSSGTDTIEFIRTIAPSLPAIDTLYRCAGSALNFSIPAQPGTTVSWSDPALTGTNVAFVQDGIYTATATNDCGSISMTYPVVSSGPPNADLGLDTVLCERIWIKPAQSNYNQIIWSTGSTADSIKVLNGTFWVSVTNGCGTDVDTVSFTTSIPPAITLPDTIESCQGQAIPLSVPFRPFASYLWSNGSTSNQTVFNALGAHWVQVSSVCDTLSDTVYIVPVSPYPIPNLSANYSLCPGDTFFIELDSLIPNSDASWSNGITGRRFWTALPGTFILSLTNSCGTVTDTFTVAPGIPPMDVVADSVFVCLGQSAVVSVAGSTADSVHWFDGSSGIQNTVSSSGWHRVSLFNACGSLVDSFYVVAEQALPNFDLGGPVAACGGSVVLTTGLGGTVNHLWSNGQTSGSLLATASGTYWVQVSNFCQTSYDTVHVDLLQFPVTNIPPVLVFCNGSTLNIDVTQTLSAYLWSDGNTSGVGSFTSAGSYWVQITNLCGTLVDSFDLQFYDPVSVDLGSDQILCLGDTLVLDAGDGNLSQLWNTGATGRFLEVFAPGNYSVTIQGFCNAATDSIDVDFLGDPVFSLGSALPVCAGGEPVTIFGPPGMSSYEWSTGTTTQQESINQPGTYWLRVGNGCYFWVDTISVVPDSAVPIDFGGDTLLCQGETLTLDAGADVYWSNGGYGRSLQIGSSGTYRCWISNTCGTYGDTIRVDYVAPLEELLLSGDACRDSVLFVEIPAEGDSLVWFDGVRSNERTFMAPGIYEFTRYNACGGSPGRFEAKFVDCDCQLFVPESFTPNSDGVNEQFNIGHSCTLKEFEFLIFDRHGGLLYRTVDPNFEWNGEVDGTQVPLGLYHWVANYRYSRNGIDPSFRSQRGSLILIR